MVVATTAVGACGGAPDGGDNEGVGATASALRPNPYWWWNCTLTYGNGSAPLGYGTYMPPTAVPPPTSPADAVNFYAGLSTALGYSPQNRIAAAGTQGWYRVQLTSAQIPAAESVVAQYINDNVVRPGVYHCTFDVGDCIDMGGTPASCHGTPQTIVAYDPHPCGSGCQ
jgi:hypothetical protein